jgi:hypothetical protein
MKLRDLVGDLVEVISPLKVTAYGSLVVMRHVLTKVERILKARIWEDDFREAAEELLQRAEHLFEGDGSSYDLEGLIQVIRLLEIHIEECREAKVPLEKCPPDKELSDQVLSFLKDLQQELK